MRRKALKNIKEAPISPWRNNSVKKYTKNIDLTSDQMNNKEVINVQKTKQTIQNDSILDNQSVKNIKNTNSPSEDNQ